MTRTRANLNLALALALWLVLTGGAATGGAAPFTATAPCVLNVYDSSPSAVKELDTQHPGIADIFTSLADGSTRDWIAKHKGEVRLLDKGAPKPSMDSKWVQDAYDAWKEKGGQYPWTVGAGPTGRGFNQSPPETQVEMLKLVAPLTR